MAKDLRDIPTVTPGTTARVLNALGYSGGIGAVLGAAERLDLRPVRLANNRVQFTWNQFEKLVCHLTKAR
jgi:hypothetical protein